MLVHRCGFVPWMPHGILCVRFNRSETELAVSREDNSIEVWHRNPHFHCRRVLAPRSATPEAARRLAWTDGERLFSAGFDGQLVEWGSSAVVHVSSAHGGPVWDMAVNPAGTHLALACEDGSIRIFDVSAGPAAYVRALQLGPSRALAVHFSPNANDRMLCAGDNAGTLQIWDWNTGRQQLRARVTEVSRSSNTAVDAAVWCVSFVSPDVVVTGDALGYTQFWDARLGVRLHGFPSHKGPVLCIASNGSTDVFTSGVDSKVCRFQLLSDGRWVCSVDRRNHEHDVQSLALGGATLVSGSLDGALGLYGTLSFSTKLGKVLLPVPPSHRQPISLSGESRIVCCRLKDRVQLWRLGKASVRPSAVARDTQSGAKCPMAKSYSPVVEIKPDTKLPLFVSAISPNGELVLVGNADGLRAYTVEQVGQEVSVMSKELPPSMARLIAVQLCFSDERENCLAVADVEGEISVFSLVDFSLVGRVSHHKGSYVAAVCIKGNTVCSLDDNSNVALHKLDTCALIHALPRFELPVTAIAIHPREPWILIASVSDRIFIFDYVQLKHSPWSVSCGDVLSTGSGATHHNRTYIAGFAFCENKANTVLFWGHNFINSVDLANVDSKNAKVKRTTHYKDIIACQNVTSSEVLVLERDWSKVLQELPPPLQRHRYVRK